MKVKHRKRQQNKIKSLSKAVTAMAIEPNGSTVKTNNESEQIDTDDADDESDEEQDVEEEKMMIKGEPSYLDTKHCKDNMFVQDTIVENIMVEVDIKRYSNLDKCESEEEDNIIAIANVKDDIVQNDTQLDYDYKSDQERYSDISESNEGGSFIEKYKVPIDSILGKYSLALENKDSRENNVESASNSQLFKTYEFETTDDCLDNKSFESKSKPHNNDQLTMDSKQVACKQCAKTFIKSSSLKTHKRIHTGEKPYSCNTCDKSFNRSDYLQKHLRTHSGEKPYRCDECNKYFSEICNLKLHKKTHTGEGTFSCQQCDKVFRRPEALADHKRTHSGERTYKCDKCDKSFYWKNYLINHKRKLHSI